MGGYLFIILGYIVILLIFNFYRAKKVKNQEDYMVAGRSLPMTVVVFTLICTWIGSGTFVAGAEYAYKAGWSSIWMPAGAWLGIAFIYFLAGRIRTFGKYTVGDILEVRYGKFARLFGSIAIIISFTAIVSYQFRAGGLILNVMTQDQDRLSYLTLLNGKKLTVKDLKLLEEKGESIFRYENIENRRTETIKASQVSQKEFKALISVNTGQIISALVVILFTALAGMMAVAYTDLPNGIIILFACIVSVPFVISTAGGWDTIKTILPSGHFEVVHSSFGKYPWAKAISYFLSTFFLLMGIQSMYQKFYSARSPRDAKQATIIWIGGTILIEVIVVVIAVFGAAYFWNKGYDPASVILLAARYMVPKFVGVLLFAAACVVVLSTGMNYLLSPSTNVMRDIYQRFINPKAEQKQMVRLQKVFVIILGVVAYLLATQLKSVLEMSYFAYVIYGVSVTPALIAALAWKRATKMGGLVSIIGGSIICIILQVLAYVLPSRYVPDGDVLGIPLIYPALFFSLASLIVVSYLTPPPKKEEINAIFGPKA